MIKGFSRLSKEEKIKYLVQYSLDNNMPEVLKKPIKSNGQPNDLIDGFSENVIANFLFPYSIAPNFLIDNNPYTIPMVTEESSVVAATSKSASFWYSRGGFKTEIIGTTKHGQVHFKFAGNVKSLTEKFKYYKADLLKSVESVNAKMKSRGGGIKEIVLVDKTEALPNYFQIDVSFNTCDAMGANYMNSCLEAIGHELKHLIECDADLKHTPIDIIMAILSNYSPSNAVKVSVETPVLQLDDGKLKLHPTEFARRFYDAVEIANNDVGRAVTHNKGIYNGIDAVALATGNDWRAIEANGHAYAARNGGYKSLSQVEICDGIFYFSATFPMQVGTVGGITSLHPMAKLSLDILENPSAEELMKIMASVGLATNFSSVKSLVTTGIQKGHMKMHLSNILTGIQATEDEKVLVYEYFLNTTVSQSAVEEFVEKLRDRPSGF